MTRAEYDRATGRGAFQFVERTMCNVHTLGGRQCIRIAGHSGGHATTETGRLLEERGILDFIKVYDERDAS